MTLDVLTALRAATAQRHTELDTRTPLAAPEPDLRAYRNHLQLLEAWLAPIHAWLLAAPLPQLQRRDYLTLIQSDLAHPALQDVAAAPALADAEPWPQQESEAYRWGVAYVIEGSQLGGAVLYKRLRERLAPHPLEYLRGEGNPGPRWQQFLTALRGAVVTAPQIEDACRGARQAFDSLIALLNSSSEETAGRP
ncbi:heme oxygenase [Duganella sp. CY15W]|uniref:biliverdin-producing heme oxygenase n=1 Tax=Duganella sp. CY15W TaxID=2692172 RepID=UPI00136F60BB|nr:biliverdin-producing heme oxygenase [Duganella sp. CY15W]MYM30366.1 heme oxygenase [Duganella sp. CY15W]